MSIGERITYLLRQQGKTASTLASVLGINKSSVTGWAKGSYPSSQYLVEIAQFLNVSVDYLLTGIESDAQLERDEDEVDIIQKWRMLDDNSKTIIKGEIYRRVFDIMDSSHENIVLRENEKLLYFMKESQMEIASLPDDERVLPVLGRSAAGQPIEMIKHIYGTLKTSGKKGTFAVIASGDSMIDAGINDGDLVIVKEQPVVENGQTALVAVGGGSTIKRVYCFDDRVELVACNPKYPPLIYYSDDDVRILGAVVEVVPHTFLDL